ncbi:MAG: hypothetical protein ACKVOU_05980 [Cytophagales bacterium]
MKKVKVYLFSAIVGAALLQGCSNASKEVVAPTVTNVNEHPNGLIQKRILYTVHVLSSAVAGNSRQEGLLDADVTVSQNGRITTKKVGQNGMAIFDDIYEGSISVYVTAAGHASVNLVNSNLYINEDADDNNSNQTLTEGVTQLVTLPTLNNGLKGRFLLDTDKDSRTSPVAAANVKVRLTYSSTIEPNVYYATTDANGSYEFVSVPGASATLSVESSFSIGTGEELQNFLITVPGETSVTPRPVTTGSVLDLGTRELGTDADRIFYSGVITGVLFGDFTFIDKSRLKAATNDVATDESLNGAYPGSISPRFNQIVDNAYSFVGVGALTQAVTNQFIDSLYRDITNLDTIPAIGSVAYDLFNNSFTISVVGLGNTSYKQAFSAANYIATDIDLTLTMTDSPDSYIGKTEFKTTVGADGRFTFGSLPLGATYELKAEKYVTVAIPGTGTSKRVKFQLTDNSTYVVDGTSFSTFTPSNNVIEVTLGATQTVSEDLGILELKY